MLAGQILESLQTVIYFYNAWVVSHVLVNNSITASLFKGLHGELITIKRLTFQCKKDASLRAVTTISCDALMLLI